MNKTLKSILSLVLCVCFVLALSACGKQNNDTTAGRTKQWYSPAAFLTYRSRGYGTV